MARSRTARNIPKMPGFSILCLMAVIAFIAVQLIFYSDGLHIGGRFGFSVAAAIFLMIYVWVKTGAHVKAIEDAERSCPGFRASYEEHEKARAKEDDEWTSQMLKGMSGAIVGGAIEGAARGCNETLKSVGKQNARR